MATAIFFDAKLCLDEDSEYCPVRATLALLGQKWVPRIVYELMNGKRRFNELACAVGGCNSRTLRDRLKGLEELDIIERRVVALMPPWVEYELTDKGAALLPLIEEMRRFGHEWLGCGVHDHP